MRLFKVIFFIVLMYSIEVFAGIKYQASAMDYNSGFECLELNGSDYKSSRTDSLPDKDATDYTIALAKAYGDSIVIRMSPSNYALWESIKKDGFIIKRGNSKSDMQGIATVFPYSEAATKSPSFSKDSLANAAAYILYGTIDKSSIQGAYKLYEANQNILGMAMIISEFSKEAANTLGFRYVDRNVVKGERYIYEISTKKFSEPKHVAIVEVSNELKVSREPYEFEVLTGDNNLELRWSMDYNKSHFTYYKIERSTDGKQFYPITFKPLLFSETDDYVRHFYNYVDSLDIVNGTKYFYRLYGGNSFAEYSPAATSSGTPRDLTPPVPPKITKATFDDKLIQFDLEWNIEIETVPADFSYYQVMASRDDGASYAAVSPKLGLADFSYTYDLGTEWKEANEGRYYFRLDCYDKSGNMSYSDFETSFVPDYTNPAAPDTLSGYIDSLSFVHLKWNKSTSKDVRGYWLYWGNSTNEELALVSKDILTDTSYQYYVPDKTLKKNLYYTVRAEDFAYNRSEVSNVVRVKLLDKIPPTRPSIKGINNDSLRLELNFELSKSDDVHYHELFRREAMAKDTNWVLLDTLWNSATYIDTSAEINVSYQYKLRAVDSTGNKSLYSPLKSGILKVSSKNSSVKIISISQKPKSSVVNLSWKLEIPEKIQQNSYSVEIYRSSGQDGVKFFKTIKSSDSNLTDTDLQSGVLYNYAVRILFDNGWTSELSEIKSILIK